MATDPRLYLIHIQEAAQRIHAYTNGHKETFLNQIMVQDAVYRNLQTLCESAHRLPEPLKQRHQHIPWTDIKDFRNLLVHDYLGSISPAQVWDVIVNHLSVLEDAVREELAAIDRRSSNDEA